MAQTVADLDFDPIALLEQELGFTNTARLQDGINGYLRFLRTEPAERSVFSGQNFVFDQRPAVELPAAPEADRQPSTEGEDPP